MSYTKARFKRGEVQHLIWLDYGPGAYKRAMYGAYCVRCGMRPQRWNRWYVGSDLKGEEEPLEAYHLGELRECKKRTFKPMRQTAPKRKKRRQRKL